MRNPFEFGRALGAEELVDRQAEVEAVTTTLLEAPKLFLYRTSALREDLDPAHGWRTRRAIGRRRAPLRCVGVVGLDGIERVLADMTSDPNRPFYKLGAVRVLGAVPRPDFIAFLERGFAADGIAVELGAAEAILDAAEDVPYNVQLLAHACWEACRATVDRGGSRHVQLMVRPGRHRRLAHRSHLSR